MSKQRRGIGYVRVSRVNGRSGESFIAPEVQRERIEQLARAKGVRIVEWITDLDESGAKYERPGFQRAHEMIEAREADAIVVARLTRYARSVLDTHRGLGRLEAVGASLLAADVDVDTTTPSGKLMRNMLAALAEFELEVIRESWAVARESAVERGVYIAATPPLGYSFDDDHKLTPHPVEADAVAELFRRRAEGVSWAKLAELFEAQTGRAVSSGSLDRVVGNRAYLGELRVGHLAKLDAHTPLVTVDEWNAANEVRAQRAPRGEASEALLGAAVLRCGSCGRTMSYRGGAGKQYTCNRTAKGERCAAPVLVDGAKLDAYVEAHFLGHFGERVAAEGAVETDEYAIAETRLAEALAERDAYIAADLVSVVGVDAFRAGAEQRQLAVDEAQQRVDDLAAEGRLGKRLAGLADTWADLDLDERRALIAEAVETVTIHRAGPRGRHEPFENRVAIVYADATSDEDRAAA